MKKISLVAAAMTAALALGACSSTDEPEEETTAAEEADTGSQTSDESAATEGAADSGDSAGETEAAGSWAGPACEEFFTEGGTLADRAETQRSALENGEVVDMATYGEVSLLKQRIDAAAKEAPEDISSLLLAVNEPFAETVDLVNQGEVVDGEGAISLPEIEVQGSADAQTELEAACQG